MSSELDYKEHYSDCTVMLYPHWNSPRCNCDELDEEAKQMASEARYAELEEIGYQRRKNNE